MLNRLLYMLPLLALAGCSPGIEMPTPTELKVIQVGYGPVAAVEVSWHVVIRAGGYLLEYGKSGTRKGTGLTLVRWPTGCGDFDGGVNTPDGSASAAMAAGDSGPDAKASPDQGVADASSPDSASPPADASSPDSAPTPADAGPSDLAPPNDKAAPPADAAWPGFTADSPVSVPAAWCQERANTYSDAGFQPAPTPASRPRLRLSGLVPGQTYAFAVRSFRLASTSAPSGEVIFTPKVSRTGGTK